MDEEYYCYPDHVDMPCLDSIEEAMSSSSDSDVSQTASEIDLTGIIETRRRKTFKQYNTDGLDPDLRVLFDKIFTQSSDKATTFYPPLLHKEMRRKNANIINSIERLKFKNCFVFVGRSLVSTLNVRNNLISIPKGILYDVCILSHSNPIILLTFVDSDNSREKIERYNELLTREVDDVLKTFMDHTVPMISGVVGKETNLKNTVTKLKEEAESSVFTVTDKSRLSLQDGTLKSAVTSFLIGISRAQTFPFIESQEPTNSDVCTLSAEELESVVSLVDDLNVSSYASKIDDPLLVLELACRKSRRRPMLLDLTKKQYSKINVPGLRKWYPNIEITDKAITKRGIISGSLSRVYQDKGKADTSDTKTLSHTKRRGKKKKKVKNTSEQMPVQREEVKTVSKEPARNSSETKKSYASKQDKSAHGRLYTLLFDFRLTYCLIVLMILCLYRKSESSWPYCFAKCAPTVYLLCVVGGYGLDLSHKKSLLLIGLMCSCIGDALFVWKKYYFQQGLVSFSFAHIAYGISFGRQPAGFKTLAAFLVFVFTLFFYFTRKIEGTVLYMLCIYTLAFCINIWRAIKTLQKLHSYNFFSAIFFLIANISISIEYSENRFQFSHQLSMTSYYLAQLCLTTLLLKSADHNIEKQVYGHERKVFLVILMVFLVEYGLPGFHIEISRRVRQYLLVLGITEILTISLGLTLVLLVYKIIQIPESSM